MGAEGSLREITSLGQAGACRGSLGSGRVSQTHTPSPGLSWPICVMGLAEQTVPLPSSWQETEMPNQVSVALREPQETPVPGSEAARAVPNPTLILCRVRSISTACTHTDTPALL